MNKAQKALIIAFEKGYRVINGELHYNNKKRGATLDKYGYLFFTVRNELKERWPIMIHRLVAYQKYGKKIFRKNIQVRHFDGIKLNNKEDNILIGSPHDNAMDKSKESRMKYAINASNSIKVHDHLKIIELHENNHSYAQIMNITGIKSKGTISFIIKKSIESKKGSTQ